MKSNFGWIFVALAIGLTAQPATAQEDAASTKALRMAGDAGSPIDWTHRHVVFSSASGDPDHQANLQREPRYWLQLARRRGSQAAGSAESLDEVKVAAAQLAWQLQHKF